MYALLRGNIYFGFRAYGPWESLVKLRSWMEEDDLSINLVPPNKADIPQRYKSAEEYTTKILDEGWEPWIVIRGSLEKGFWFVGPLTKEDAEKIELNYGGDIRSIMPLVTLEKPT